MQTHTRRRVVAGIATLGALAVVALAPRRAAAQREEVRTLEVFAARYALDDRVGTNKQNLDGFGVRFMYDRRDPTRPAASFLDRARGGAFATYTAKQGSPNLSTLHVGLQTDLSFLQNPLGGVLDPFFSFGLGIFRTSRENVVTTTRAGKRIVESSFSFVPGLGTRIGFGDRLGARVDVRAPFLFGTSSTANFVGEGGLYVNF
jgi:hypothetical protein